MTVEIGDWVKQDNDLNMIGEVQAIDGFDPEFVIVLWDDNVESFAHVAHLVVVG